MERTRIIIIVTIFIFIICKLIECNTVGYMSQPHTTIPLSTPNDTTYLWMLMNQLTSLEAHAFTHLPLLNHFAALGNQISYVDPQAFAGLSNFEILDLEVNRITYVPDLRVVKNTLKELLLSRNDLSNITFLHDFPVLEKFDVSGNALTSFPNITIIMQTLKSLIIFGNKIHEINLQHSFGIVMASSMDSCNDFDRYKMNDFEELIMSDNELVEFPSEMFYLMPNLKFLLLEKNNLTKMPFLDKSKYCHVATYVEINLVDNLFNCGKEMCFLKDGTSPDPVTFHFSYSKNSPDAVTFPLSVVSGVGRSAIDINNGEIDKTVVYINNIAFCTTPERLMAKEFGNINNDELYCNGMCIFFVTHSSQSYIYILVKNVELLLTNEKLL